MSSPPEQPTTPDTQSWWDLMEDAQDEHYVSPKRHYQSAVHRAKQAAARHGNIGGSGKNERDLTPRGLVKLGIEERERNSFWSQLNIMSSRTDDEEDTLEESAMMPRLSRSSFGSNAVSASRPGSRPRLRVSSSSGQDRSRSRSASASHRRLSTPNNKATTTTTKNRDQSDQATVDTCTLKNEVSGNIFELFEQNVCTLDLTSPKVVKSLEASIEKGILDLDSPSLWNYLRPKEEQEKVPPQQRTKHWAMDDMGVLSLSTDNSSHQSDPTDISIEEESVASESTSEVLREISHMVPQRQAAAVVESSNSAGSAKYKEMLTKRNQAKLRMERGLQKKKRPTKAPLKSESSDEDEDDDEESAFEMMPATSFDLRNRKNEMQPSTVLVAESRSQSSYLPEDIIRTRVDLVDHDQISRSCMSPKFMRGIKALTHVKMVTSHSTASTSQLTSGTDPSRMTAATAQTVQEKASNAGYSQQYVYNTQHAYTAYFERGLKASDCLRLYEHPTPEAFPTLPTEVVVRVEYSSVSTTDCKVRQGVFWGEDSYQPLNLPIVPGVTFAGTIVQIGKAASRSGLQLGDRVLSLVRVGANSRHLCIDKERLVKVPSAVNDGNQVAALACLPELYLGAFQALHLNQKTIRYKLQSLSGKSIVVLGGGTLLGHALIELARAGNARTVYATGKERHFPSIEALGAVPLNRDPCHWFSLLEGRIDVVVGAAAELQLPSELNYNHTKVLSSKGKLVLLADPSKTDPTQGEAKMDDKIYEYNVFDSWLRDMKEAKRDLTHLVKLLYDRVINPRILDTIPLSKIPRAQDSLEVKKVSGFIVCNPWLKTAQREKNVIPRTVIYTESASLASTALSEEFLHGYNDGGDEENENYEIVKQGFRRVVV